MLRWIENGYTRLWSHCDGLSVICAVFCGISHAERSAKYTFSKFCNPHLAKYTILPKCAKVAVKTATLAAFLCLFCAQIGARKTNLLVHCLNITKQNFRIFRLLCHQQKLKLLAKTGRHAWISLFIIYLSMNKHERVKHQTLSS